ncbi:MAG TPA: PAS domain S-box protein, partial [Verrucomicrobiae bacterium]
VRYENLPLESKNGRHMAVEFVSNVYQAGDKKVIQCNIRDITERKRAEEKLKLFRLLIERSNDAIEVVDSATGRFLDVSESGCRALGYTRDELLSLTMFDLTPEVNRALVDATNAELKIAGHATLETLRRRKDGTAYPVEVSLSSVTLDREYVVAIVRDITERRKMEAQFIEAQKMEAVGQLAGGVAHDFNNILGVIIGYGDLITADLEPDSPLRKYAEEIRLASERAAGLTRQLLIFSRKQKVQPVVLDLNETVKNLDKMLRRLIGENIEMIVVPGNEVGRIKADPGYLWQVLMNLVVNARDAMPNGGKLTIATQNVTLDGDYSPCGVGVCASPGDAPLFTPQGESCGVNGGTSPGQVHPVTLPPLSHGAGSSAPQGKHTHTDVIPGDYVMLSVSDTGTGMTDEVKARIFEAFFTTQPAGKGTGLGLATCQTIVQQSGGHIDVDSEVGKGTTFKIYFPLVDEPLDSDTKFIKAGPLPRGTETLLVVEDEPSVRHLAAGILEAQGYTVLRAVNGQDALRMVHEHKGSPIRLVVTDVIMPLMGGKVMADWLKTTCPGLKILFTSGYTDDAIARQGVLEPGIAFLPKPYSPRILACKVRAMLDNQTDSAFLRKHSVTINEIPPGSA